MITLPQKHGIRLKSKDVLDRRILRWMTTTSFVTKLFRCYVIIFKEKQLIRQYEDRIKSKRVYHSYRPYISQGYTGES